MKLRKCLRYAISGSVTESTTTNKVNLYVLERSWRKLQQITYGPSSVFQEDVEHKCPNIFNVVTQLIEEKTTIKLDMVKDFISRVLRARTSSDNASKKKENSSTHTNSLMRSSLSIRRTVIIRFFWWSRLWFRLIVINCNHIFSIFWRTYLFFFVTKEYIIIKIYV